jgi:hypothetical protein
MTIDVEDVATDADLETYTLGKSNLQKLLPDEWLQDPDAEYDADENPRLATIPRQTALDVTLGHLRKRRPPIEAEDLADVTELKTAVCYGALEILYRGSIQHEDSPNVARAKSFGKMFADELTSLQPSVHEGSTASSLSIRMSRG